MNDRRNTGIRQSGLVVTAMTILLFQNCSGGFSQITSGSSLEGSSGASSATQSPSPSPSPTPTPTPAPTSKTPPTASSLSVVGTEMQPLQVNLKSGQTFSAANLPAGSSFAAATGTFLWLPQQGQAGNYQLTFTGATTTVSLNLQINAVTSAALAMGAVDGSADGDVGFVFIHGMGNLDYCANPTTLAAYWGNTPSVIARAGVATVACYDGRAAVEAVAPLVAQQIINANCGKFNKCVLITHSMGGLVAEHILTHARAALATDPEPDLFANAALYLQAKQKILNVVSIASAAGGSKIASLVDGTSQPSGTAELATLIADKLGENLASTASLVVTRASDVLAPIAADPGIAVYMVPGYTTATSEEDPHALLELLLGEALDLTVYDGNIKYAGADPIVLFNSRSDGLVEFRSSCGIASDSETDGLGYTATLAQHLAYCYGSPKKPNHVVWFLSNMNHSYIATPWTNCNNSANPCTTLEPSASTGTFTSNSFYLNQPAVNVIRTKLDLNRQTLNTSTLNL